MEKVWSLQDTVLGKPDVGMLENKIQLLYNKQISTQKGIRLDVGLEVVKPYKNIWRKFFDIGLGKDFFFNITSEIGNNNNNRHMRLH